jgi:hypothetical protein
MQAAVFMLRRATPFGMPFRDMEAYRICTWRHGLLPRVVITEAFPGIEKCDVTIKRAFDRTIGTSLDAHELFQICAIEQFIGAKNILEIGTFDGNTALNLAVNAKQGGRVTTIDLPPNWDGKLHYKVPKSFLNVTDGTGIGKQYLESQYEAQITQVLGDSAQLDWEKLGGPFDLILIDGCHHYDYVKMDTQNSFKHLAPDGVIVWHDYGMIKDVSRLVDEVAKKHNVFSLRGTRIAVYRKEQN